jgi:hypothetical protein
MVQVQTFNTSDSGSWDVPDGVKKLRLVVEGQDGRYGSTTAYTFTDGATNQGNTGSGGLATGYLTDTYLSYDGNNSLYLKPGTGPSGGSGAYAREDEYNSDNRDPEAVADSGAGGSASVVYLNGDGGTMVLVVGGGGGGSAAAGITVYDSSDDPRPNAANSGGGGLTSAGNGADTGGLSDEVADGGAGGGAGTDDGEGGKSNDNQFDGSDTEYLGAAASGGGGGGWSGSGGSSGDVNFAEGSDNPNVGGSGGGQGAIGIASNVTGTLGGSTAQDGQITIEYTDRVTSVNATGSNTKYFGGSIDVSWSGVDSSGYKLYRSTSSGQAKPNDYTEIADVGTSTSYTDNAVSSEQSYYYRILSKPSDTNLGSSMGIETAITTSPALGSSLRTDSGVLETDSEGNIITE